MENFRQLEQEFAAWVGVEPAGMVACSSGTAALTLAFEALELPRPSKVICSDFSMIACPRSISMAGHEPLFVDCKEDLNIDATLLPKTEDFNPTALLAVNTYGRICSVETGMWADNLRIPIVEDCAETPYKQGYCTWAAASCWSFFKNKVVAGEEGGMVYFHNPAHAKLARMLRSQGFTEAHDFWHVPRGANYRLSNANADLIRHSLRNADANLAKRKQIESWYDHACPKEWRMPERKVPWIYDMRIKNLGWPKMDEVIKALNAVGIAARHSFKPCHRQPEYTETTVVGGAQSWLASQEVFYLPIQPDVTAPESVRQAFDVIHRLLEQG